MMTMMTVTVAFNFTLPGRSYVGDWMMLLAGFLWFRGAREVGGVPAGLKAPSSYVHKRGFDAYCCPLTLLHPSYKSTWKLVIQRKKTKCLDIENIDNIQNTT